MPCENKVSGVSEVSENMNTVKPDHSWSKVVVGMAAGIANIAAYFIAACMLALSTGVFASPLVFSFVNPTFGGNPYNETGLMATAVAQNTTKAPVQSELTTFNNNLQSAILSHLTQLSITTIFKGDTTLQVGTYQTGQYTIQVASDSSGNLTVTTTDNTSGASASFQIANNSVGTGQ
jgi:curli production assembly/transport component CsgF